MNQLLSHHRIQEIKVSMICRWMREVYTIYNIWCILKLTLPNYNYIYQPLKQWQRSSGSRTRKTRMQHNPTSFGEMYCFFDNLSIIDPRRHSQGSDQGQAPWWALRHLPYRQQLLAALSSILEIDYRWAFYDDLSRGGLRPVLLLEPNVETQICQSAHLRLHGRVS